MDKVYWSLAHVGYSALVAGLCAESSCALTGAARGAALIGPLAAIHGVRLGGRLSKQFPGSAGVMFWGGILGGIGGSAEGALVGAVSSRGRVSAGIFLAVSIALLAELAQAELDL